MKYCFLTLIYFCISVSAFGAFLREEIHLMIPKETIKENQVIFDAYHQTQNDLKEEKIQAEQNQAQENQAQSQINATQDTAKPADAVPEVIAPPKPQFIWEEEVEKYTISVPSFYVSSYLYLSPDEILLLVKEHETKH